MSWVQVPSLAPSLPVRHAIPFRLSAASSDARQGVPLAAAGPHRTGALALVDHMDDAGPGVAAANVVAIDHLVEPLGPHPGGPRSVLSDHLAREALNLH